MASISMTIKADLKKLGANVVSVRTDRAYSLSVVIQDAKPGIRGKCRDYLDTYKMGDYNMVEDIYEYRKNKDDKPKFHFVFLSNKISDELRERAFQRMRRIYDIYESFTGTLNENAEKQGFNNPVAIEVSRFLYGEQPQFAKETAEFWNEIEKNKS